MPDEHKSGTVSSGRAETSLELPFDVVLPNVCELILSYNGHNGSYMSIEEYFEDCLGSSDEWLSEKDRKLAIENNSVWHIHWYPNTPIGSYKILCHKLKDGLKALLETANARG